MSTFAILILILSVVLRSRQECNVIINEINSDTPPANGPVETKPNQFYELRFFCDKHRAPNLQGYRLLVIRAMSVKNLGKAEAILYVQFKESDSKPFKKGELDYYFVVGQTEIRVGDEIVTSNISFTENRVAGTHHTSRGKSSVRKLFPGAVPKGNDVPYAVLLLHADAASADGQKIQAHFMHFTEKKPMVPLDEAMIRLLLKPGIIVDMVVYGKRTPFTKCDIFNRLTGDKWSSLEDYVLRDWDVMPADGSESLLDRSISHCGEDEELGAFMPWVFRSTEISPGTANNCDENHAYLVLSEHIASQGAQSSTGNAGAEHIDPTEYSQCTTRVVSIDEESNRDVMSDADDPDDDVIMVDQMPKEPLSAACENRRTPKELIGAAGSCYSPYGQGALQGSSNAEAFQISAHNERASSSRLPEQEPAVTGIVRATSSIIRDRKRRQFESLEDEVHRSPAKTQKTMKERAESDKWWEMDSFDDTWLDRIRESQELQKIFNLEWFELDKQYKHPPTFHPRHWVHFEFNPDNPLEGIIKCSICNKAKLMGIHSSPQEQHRLIDGVSFQLFWQMIKGGEALKERRRILKYIKKHEWFVEESGGKDRTGPTSHTHIIRDIELRSKSLLQKSYTNQMKKAAAEVESGKYKATTNMFICCYMEAKLNVPFMHHQTVSNTLARMDVKIGKIHHSRRSGTRIINFISNEMHADLVNHLCTEESWPFSLIIDGTTDRRGQHYIIVYIRAMETSEPEPKQGQETSSWQVYKRPVTYFYKLIALEGGETAQIQLDALVNAFEEDNKINKKFSETMKKQLIAFGSDGASVNTGRRNGLIAKFRQWTGNQNIVGIHCQAHKLQLTIKHALVDEQPDHESYVAYRELGSITNQLYGFFGAFKKREVLKNMAIAMEEQFFEMIYIFPVRWVATSKTAMSKFFKMFAPIVESLLTIYSDNDFDRVTKATAKGYADLLTERPLLFYLVFILDMLDQFTWFSEEVQRKDATIIGTSAKVTELKGRLYRLSNPESPGTYMSTLLTKARCGENEDSTTRCQSLRRLEDSPYVSYNYIELKPQRKSRWPKLSSTADSMISAVVSKLDEDFSDNDILEAVDAFDQKLLPTSSEECATYKLQDIILLAETFGVHETNAATQWKTVLQQTCGTDIDNSFRNAGPVWFWSKVLGDKRFSWETKGALEKIVRSVLVMPSGSVDAERGFSILKHIKYDRRSRLSEISLDALLRIRVNGVPVEKFNPMKYVTRWISSGKSRSDDTTGHQTDLNAKELLFMNSVTDFVDDPEKEEGMWRNLQRSNLF